MRSKRNNTSLPRRRRRVNRRVPPMLKTALDGRQITPSSDPSTIVETPWNSITLTFDTAVPEASKINLTLAEVDQALRAIYPSSTTTGPAYSYRIRSARLWELTGASFSADFHSLETPIGVISNQSDTAGRNQWARIGYIWPRSHQNIVLLNTATPLIDVVVPTAADVLLHIDILWRTSTAYPPVPKTVFRNKFTKSLLPVQIPQSDTESVSPSDEEEPQFEDAQDVLDCDSSSTSIFQGISKLF